MNMFAGPLGLLAGFVALIPIVIWTFVNWIMLRDIKTAETEERRLYLASGRKQMFAVSRKFLLVALILAAVAAVLAIS